MKLPPSLFLGAVLLFCAGCESASAPTDLGAAILNPRATQVAVTSIDPRWTSYGIYLKGVTSSIQAQWNEIREENLNAITDGSTVSVAFILNSDGQVSRVLDHDDHGTQASTYTIHACIQAVGDGAPYALWTDEMIAALGKEQKIVVTFFVRS
jgi:hypothetical protein